MRGEELIFQYFSELTPTQRSQFAALQELYEHWNAQINVISRRDMDGLYEHHVLHSLAIARCGLIVDGQSVLDVGCGGGFPSIPLAILMPSVQFTAVDSIGKKIHVVREISSALGLVNVKALNCRVETLSEQYDWVVSRAVSKLPQFMEWTRGRYRRGILYLKGGDLDGDLGEELTSVGGIQTVFSISEWFVGDFFDTKKVVFLEKNG